MKKQILLAATLIMCLFQSAHATVIYQVDRNIGAAGTVTGFIETDGTLGALSIGSIIDWSLDYYAPNVNGGVVSSSNFGSSTFGSASLLTATSTDLLFDFSVAGIFGFWSDDHSDWWCLAGGAGGDNGCFISPGESMGYSDTTNAYAQYTNYTGTVAIASVSSSVPEPSTVLLIALGLVGFTAARRNRIK